MVSVLPSSVVNRGFEPRSSKTNDYKIGICCFYKMCFNIQCNVRCCHFSQSSHWIASFPVSNDLLAFRAITGRCV